MQGAAASQVPQSGAQPRPQGRPQPASAPAPAVHQPARQTPVLARRLPERVQPALGRPSTPARPPQSEQIPCSVPFIQAYSVRPADAVPVQHGPRLPARTALQPRRAGPARQAHPVPYSAPQPQPQRCQTHTAGGHPQPAAPAPGQGQARAAAGTGRPDQPAPAGVRAPGLGKRRPAARLGGDWVPRKSPRCGPPRQPVSLTSPALQSCPHKMHQRLCCLASGAPAVQRLHARPGGQALRASACAGAQCQMAA